MCYCFLFTYVYNFYRMYGVAIFLTIEMEKENDIKEIIECLKALEGIKKKLLNVILKEEKKK